MTNAKKTILLATDVKSIQDDVRTLLGKGGHTVLIAETLEEGIETAKTQTFDALVLDLNSKALGGYIFLESLLNNVVLKSIPAIIVMARSPADIDENKNLTLGVKDHVIVSGSVAAAIGTKLLPVFGGAGVDDPFHTTGFTILIVEDDNFLRDLLARKLGQENCQFIAAIDGENALRLINENKPSLVLLDLILPGIDGFEVLAKIKENPELRNIPVVILSNLGQDSDIKRARDLGADDFLIKANFSIDEVIGKIKELVKNKKKNGR